jgi:hypothetical protein
MTPVLMSDGGRRPDREYAPRSTASPRQRDPSEAPIAQRGRRYDPTARNVLIPEPHWQALRLVAEIGHQSISAVVRVAVERHIERYGLVIETGGELAINRQLWPTEVISRNGISQAEILPGDQETEICEGDQISAGDPNLPGGPEPAI